MKSAFLLALALLWLVGCATSSKPHVVEYRVLRGRGSYVEDLLNKAATEGYSLVSWSLYPSICVTVERDSSVRRPVFEYRIIGADYTTNLQVNLNEHAQQNFR